MNTPRTSQRKQYNLLCVVWGLGWLLLLGLIGLAPQAQAATLYVGPGETYTTIQAGIDAAVNGDIVILRRGTYTSFSGTTYIPGNSDLDFYGKAITLRSEDGNPANTIIDVGCSPTGCPDGLRHRGFYFHYLETSASALEGVTIRNGYASSGGGIYMVNSSPTIKNVNIFNNTAISEGGGLLIFGFFALPSPSLINVRIAYNTAVNGGGMINNNSAAALKNVKISENTAAELGGGMYNVSSAPTLAEVEISGNTATQRGGGIYNDAASPKLTNVTLANNTADDGGGMYNGSSSSPILTYVTISGNHATDKGGGMRNSESSPILKNVIISGNIAGVDGGGMFNETNSSPTLTNVLIIKNTAGGDGGGIYNETSSYPTLTNVTIDRNDADSDSDGDGDGDGMCNNLSYEGKLITITNSIIWDAMFTTTPPGFPVLTVLFQYSDIRGSGGSADWHSSFGLNGGGNIDLSPVFMDAGTANDFRLQSNSPCIDTGKNVTGLYSDLRGSLRPVDVDPMLGGNSTSNNFDMGAYEYSDLYAGVEDGVVKPFQNVALNSSLVITGYQYNITWQNKSPFPGSDRRVSQAGFYDVRFVLYNKGTRIELGTTQVSTQPPSPSGYSWAFTFMEKHVGVWKLRLELVNDSTLFAEGNVEIQTFAVEDWIISAPLTPPASADLTKQPQWTGATDLFFWDAANQLLYAIKPAQNIQLTWKDAANNPLPAFGNNIWCTPQDPQTCTLPQTYVAGTAAVDLLPEGSAYDGVSLVYSESNAVIENTDQFSATVAGYSVVKYGQGGANFEFKVIKTVEPEPDSIQSVNIGTAINPPAGHDATCGGGVIINANTAPYAPNTLESEPYDGYDRATRAGPIVPVNTYERILIAWYRKDAAGSCWPFTVIEYRPVWPSGAPGLVIGATTGSGNTLNGKTSLRIYAQDNRNLPGYNPNEEHALIYGGKAYALRNDLNSRLNASQPYTIVKFQNPDAANRWEFQVFSVSRGALTYAGTAGDLVQLPLPLNTLAACAETTWSAADEWLWWKDYNNNLYSRKAGTGTLRLYYPLQAGFFYDFDRNGTPDVTVGTCIPWLGGTAGPPADVTYDITWPDDPVVLNVGDSLINAQDGLEIAGQCSAEIVYDEAEVAGNGKSVKLLEATSDRFVTLGATGERVDQVLPADVKYRELGGGVVSFPDLPPHLTLRLFYDYVKHQLIFRGYFDNTVIGEPLLLPNIMSVSERETIKSLATDLNDPNLQEFEEAVDLLYARTQAWSVSLGTSFALAESITTQPVGGGFVIFSSLADGLRQRVFYHHLSRSLIYQGALLNGVPTAMTAGEQTALQNLFPGSGASKTLWNAKVAELQVKTGLPLSGAAKIVGSDVFKILSAASPEGGSGYVTVAFNNDETCAGNPVGLKVLQVGCDQLARGELKRLYPENPFDERTTFVHSNDFAGNADALTFEWQYAFSDTPPCLPDETGCGVTWMPLVSGVEGQGANYYTLGGAGLQVLEDKWVTARYKGYSRCDPDLWSAWTYPVFYENWIKRVMTAITPFEQRFKNFHEQAAATYVSMIQQAGPRYEGDVALNYDADYLNKIGLIELYATVLKRGRELSIDGTPPQSTDESNNALLFAASRIADLYLLLGNEAYSDATDPTIGFTTDTATPGNAAPSMFCFQNQVASLLQEELELLRGRDASRAPNIQSRPVYNRLIWNFTSGSGQVAYVNNYGVETVNDIMDDHGTPADPSDDTVITPGARSLYPQGHGDGWGHYLTAMTTYYELLRHDLFDWQPRAETVTIKGVDADVSVDFLDERKFAAAAAAKARTGAEIVNLTYRDAYVDNPQEQWQGYTDDDPDRAWGLSEWAVRAGQGTLLDWVVANAVLPDLDTNPAHTGIQKIDRHTVAELAEIASQFTAIENELEQADLGLNPLGLAKDAIPFDIDPVAVDAGQTHFEQIYARALEALNNARIVFDYANQYSQLLRSHQDTQETYQQNVAEREADLNNRLIEVFGYPYPDDDCALNDGPDGPDICHYMYVDPSAILGYDPTQDYLAFTVNIAAVDSINLSYAQPDGCPGPACVCPPEANCAPVTFHLSEQFGLIKPPAWTRERKAPGEIQRTRSDLLLAKANFDRAYDIYQGLMADIQEAVDLLDLQYGLNAEQIEIMNYVRNQKIGLNTAMLALTAAQKGLETAATIAKGSAESTSECYPKIMGMIAGLSNGTIMDPTAPMRCATKAVGENVAAGLLEGARWLELAGTGLENTKEVLEYQADIELTTAQNDFAIQEKLRELAHLMRDETTGRYDMYLLYEQVLQAAGAHSAAIAKGERLLQERSRYRQKVADDIREYRYKDMAFRIFRNDALQKYRAQFDLAAMYAYLAAKAYDYETGLLHTQNQAGTRFFADIVRQRTIGKIEIQGNVAIPMVGSGLANQLAQLAQNFAVLKGQMGFNNPQIEDNRFSLRTEYVRRLAANDPRITLASEADWQTWLRTHWKQNLWNVPAFRQYCRPFSQSTQEEPALVIPFQTTITSRLNFFGWPLSGGDSYYDASRFATKIRRVGVWFKGYDTSAMSYTPRVYLVPVGADIMRVPYSDSIATRSFSVVDQIIPTIFPLDGSQVADPAWSPALTMANQGQNFLAIRRYSRMRAYPYSGDTGWENQLQWDSRLIGRSVWNGEWLLIIPGASLNADAEQGLTDFINSVTDVLFTFQTYSYEGYRKSLKTAQPGADMIPE